jgi:hypothetical protein
MSWPKQMGANGRNVLHSTGPGTADGKLRSECNAVRQGMTASTTVGTLEDQARTGAAACNRRLRREHVQ